MMVFDRFIHYVLQQASKQKGKTGSNPVTACVILKPVKKESDYSIGRLHGHILGKGIHQGAGHAHAEVLAIQDVLKKHGKQALIGATLVVNLEPCTHRGQTPPCVDAIINAGISTVVYAVNDPDARVRKHPARQILEAKGIRVVGPVNSLKASMVNDVFFKNQSTKKPLVILKAGISLDGKIALGNYVSQFITGEDARKDDHALRREVDAILIGKGTAIHDNPRLNVRYNLLTKGYKNPLVIVLDAHGELLDDLQLFEDASRLCLIVGNKPPSWLQSKSHVQHIVLDSAHPNFWNRLLEHLFKQGIGSVLIEGGQGVYTSAYEAGVVDKCVFYIAPKLLGGSQDMSVISGESQASLADCSELSYSMSEQCGNDIKVVGYLNTNFLDIG